MPCGPTCACIGESFECLAVIDPDRFGYFKEWCASEDAGKRAHVRNRSRIGIKTDLSHEPNLVQKAAHFVKAAAEHVVAGMPEVDDKTYEARLALCHSCVGPGGFYDADRDVCTHATCGCVMSRKARWADQACPIGRWAARSTQNTLSGQPKPTQNI